MHRAGASERGGASYGRHAVATAEWAAMQISLAGKGLNEMVLWLLLVELCRCP